MANNRISILVALDGADDGLKRAIASAEKSFQEFSGSAQAAGNRISESVAGIQGKLAEFNDRVASLRNQVLATFGAAWAAGKAQELLELGDAWNSLSARLKLATTSESEYAAAQEALFGVAQETRSDLESTITLYTKTQQAVKNLGGTQQDAVDLTRAIAEAFQVSGASAQESSAGIQQLSQALASGVLRGDEFNSVMESSPRLALALADGLGVPISQLRALAEQGQLTADKVVSALLSQKDKLAAEYAQLPVTVEGALTQAKNSLLKYVGELNQSLGATQAVAGAVQGLAHHIDDLGAGAGLVAGILAGQGLKALNGYAVAAAEAARATLKQRTELAAAREAALQSLAVGAESAKQLAEDARVRVGLTRKLAEQAQAEVDLAAKKKAGALGSASALAAEQAAAETLGKAQANYRAAQAEARTATEAATAAHAQHQDALAGTAAKTTLAEKALGALNGAVSLLQAGLIGFEIGQFLTKFESIRIAGSYVAEAFSTVMLGADQLQRFLNGSLTWDQAIAEGKKLHAEYDAVRQGLTDTARDGEAANQKLTDSQKALADAMKPLQGGLAGVSAESMITDAAIEQLRLRMAAAQQAADEKTAALGRAKAGTAEYTQAQEAAKQANAAATAAVTQYTQALAEAVKQRDSELKVAKALTEQITAEYATRKQALEGQLAAARAAGDEAQALRVLGELKALEVKQAADLVTAKQREANAAAAHVQALEAEAQATGGVSDKEREGIEAAKATALAAKEAADGARLHYEALAKLPASLEAVKTEQALTTEEIGKYKQAAAEAIAAAQQQDQAYRSGKIGLGELAQANADAQGKLETYTQALRAHIEQLGLQEAAVSREADLDRQRIDLKINAVRAQADATRAAGDETRAVELNATALRLEAEQERISAAEKQKQAAIARQLAADLEAQAKADGTLTQEEQAQIEAAKQTAEAKELEAEKHEQASEAKRQEAEASEQEAQANREAKRATEEQTQAQQGLTTSMEQAVALVDVLAAQLAQYGQAGVNALREMYAQSLSFEQDWRALDFGQQLLQDAQRQAAEVERLSQRLQEASSSGKGLAEALNDVGAGIGRSDDIAGDLQQKFNLLDDQHLSGLVSAIQSAQDALDSLSASATSTLNSLLDELDSLEGRQADIEQRRYETRKADIEDRLAEARAQGNAEAVSTLEKALDALERLHAAQQRKTASKRAQGGPVRRFEPYLVGEEGPEVFVPDGNGVIVPHRSRPPTTLPAADSAPIRTIRVELTAGSKRVTATLDARDETRLLDLLKDAQSRAL